MELATIFRGPLRSYQESAYASLHNSTCNLKDRCLSDADCKADDTSCFVPSDVRWSNRSACSPTSTLGYSAKCGCCVLDKTSNILPRTIKSLVVICSTTDDDEENESHSISINSTSILVDAKSFHGAARGLATVAQLLRYDTDENTLVVDVVPLEIYDEPLYSWRGLVRPLSIYYLSLFLSLSLTHTHTILSHIDD